MQPFKDLTAAINEPKDARMEQRVKPHVKATIQKAAALLGVDETTFISNAAYERAQETLNSHERTILKEADYEAFFAALNAPGEPSEALKETFAEHKERVRRGA